MKPAWVCTGLMASAIRNASSSGSNARDREHAMRRREVDDLGVLEHVDAEAEAGFLRIGTVDHGVVFRLAGQGRLLLRPLPLRERA